MPRASHLLPAACLVVVLLASAGCGGGKGPGPPDEATGLYNGAALEPWLATLERSGGARADVLLIGDSITEGLGTEWDGRPAALLQDMLRDQHPSAGEEAAGYLPAANFAALTAPWATTGSPEVTDSFGLGSKAIALRSGQTITYRGELASFRLWFGSAPEETADGLVSIDDGPFEPISPAAGPASGQTWDSADLGPGLHQIAVTGAAQEAPFVLEAVEVFGSDDDRDHGVHVYDGSHSGFASSSWLAPDLASGRIWQAAAAVEPDVTVINLGTNDRFLDVSPGEVARQVGEIANRAGKAAGDGDHPVLVVVPYRTSSQELLGGPDPAWDEIRACLLKVAQDNVAVLDLDSYWPDLTGDQGAETGLMLEERWPVHPNPTGYRAYAVILAAALTGEKPTRVD